MAILMSDDFTGTTIDTSKWDETDPDGLISQDDRLIYSNPHSKDRGRWENILKSDISSSADVITLSCHMDWTPPGSSEAYGGITLWKDNNNWAQIASRAPGGGAFLWVNMKNGTQTSGTLTTKNKNIKMVYTRSTGNLNFSYWNGSSWTSVQNSSQNTGQTYYAIIDHGDGTTFNGADLVYYDDLFLTDEDFSTQYPSSATLRKIRLAGSFVEKPILTKVAGSFVDKPIKIKIGGTFQDA